MNKILCKYILDGIDNRLTKILNDALTGDSNHVGHYRTSIDNLINEIRAIKEGINRN